MSSSTFYLNPHTSSSNEDVYYSCEEDDSDSVPSDDDGEHQYPELYELDNDEEEEVLETEDEATNTPSIPVPGSPTLVSSPVDSSSLTLYEAQEEEQDVRTILIVSRSSWPFGIASRPNSLLSTCNTMPRDPKANGES